MCFITVVLAERLLQMKLKKKRTRIIAKERNRCCDCSWQNTLGHCVTFNNTCTYTRYEVESSSPRNLRNTLRRHQSRFFHTICTYTMHNSRAAFVIYIAVKRDNDAAKSPPACRSRCINVRARMNDDRQLCVDYEPARQTKHSKSVFVSRLYGRPSRSYAAINFRRCRE